MNVARHSSFPVAVMLVRVRGALLRQAGPSLDWWRPRLFVWGCAVSDWSKCLHNPELVGDERKAVLAGLDRTRQILDASSGMEVRHGGWHCRINPMETKPAVVTYSRTRRSWLSDAQSFMDWLLILLLASVFLNMYLAFRVLEASK